MEDSKGAIFLEPAITRFFFDIQALYYSEIRIWNIPKSNPIIRQATILFKFKTPIVAHP